MTQDNREQRAINKAKEDPAVFLFFLRMDKQALAAVRARAVDLGAAGYKDFHTVTAAAAFDVKPEDVTKEQRRAAKAFNFWDLYSMGRDPSTIASVVLGNRAPISPTGRLTASRPNVQDMRPENERLAENATRFASNYGMGKNAMIQAANAPDITVEDAEKLLEAWRPA